MRQITASAVKPGMTVKFDMDGWHVEGTVSRVEPVTFGLEFYSTQGVEMTLCEDTLVTVLSEPTPPQPEEPTEFGACVETPHWTDEHGCNRFVWDDLWWRCGRGGGYMWEAITEGGAVKVINPDPFARAEEVPEDTPKTPTVPERIEEWDTWGDVPEGVAVTTPGLSCHYRKNQGVIEFSDPYKDPDWTEHGVRYMPRTYTPWTRVSDV